MTVVWRLKLVRTRDLCTAILQWLIPFIALLTLCSDVLLPLHGLASWRVQRALVPPPLYRERVEAKYQWRGSAPLKALLLAISLYSIQGEWYHAKCHFSQFCIGTRLNGVPRCCCCYCCGGGSGDWPLDPFAWQGIKCFALCPLSSAFCPLSFVLCPLSSALCLLCFDFHWKGERAALLLEPLKPQKFISLGYRLLLPALSLLASLGAWEPGSKIWEMIATKNVFVHELVRMIPQLTQRRFGV